MIDPTTDNSPARDLESNHKTISEALASALKAYSILTREQKTALARVLEGFVTALSVNATPNLLLVIAADGWDHRVDWTQVQWECWETWGWYRHFCRYVSLRPFLFDLATAQTPASFLFSMLHN
jgi:nuclear cap-binding protein subunit 1